MGRASSVPDKPQRNRLNILDLLRAMPLRVPMKVPSNHRSEKLAL